jgi:Mg/Co/Ni transporter MgtE
MSARAASRLETLGFRAVYRYQPGKADWFAAGWPREGADAGTARVGDVATRDVPTCGIGERVAGVRDRLRGRGEDACVVVGAQGVVLGLLEGAALTDAAPDIPVERVMRADPITFRPDVRAGELPEYVKTRRIPVAVVTTSDGVLVGLLRLARPGSRAA